MPLIPPVPLEPVLPPVPLEPGSFCPDPLEPGLLGFPGLLWLPDLFAGLLPLVPPLEPLMPLSLPLLRSSPRESRPAFPLSLDINPPAHSARVCICLLTSIRRESPRT